MNITSTPPPLTDIFVKYLFDINIYIDQDSFGIDKVTFGIYALL